MFFAAGHLYCIFLNVVACANLVIFAFSDLKMDVRVLASLTGISMLNVSVCSGPLV
jgi:hypothetical protein